MRAELHAFSNCDAADMTARVTPRFPRYRALPQGRELSPLRRRPTRAGLSVATLRAVTVRRRVAL